MKKILVAILISLLWFVPAFTFAQESPDPPQWTGNLNLFLGAKVLEKENWEPVDRPLEIGLLFDFKHNRWPISAALDFFYAAGDDSVDIVDLGIGAYSASVESRIIELDMGIRKIWAAPRNMRPFLGGGLSIIHGRIESTSLDESTAMDDTGFGIWMNTGIYVTLSERFNLGVDIRWSKAEIDLYHRQTRVGGWHFGLQIGYHW